MTDSELSAYDFNSDDEAPKDLQFENVIISPDAKIVMQRFRTSFQLNTPTWNSEVIIKLKEISTKELENGSVETLLDSLTDVPTTKCLLSSNNEISYGLKCAIVCMKKEEVCCIIYPTAELKYSCSEQPIEAKVNFEEWNKQRYSLQKLAYKKPKHFSFNTIFPDDPLNCKLFLVELITYHEVNLELNMFLKQKAPIYADKVSKGDLVTFTIDEHEVSHIMGEEIAEELENILYTLKKAEIVLIKLNPYTTLKLNEKYNLQLDQNRTVQIHLLYILKNEFIKIKDIESPNTNAFELNLFDVIPRSKDPQLYVENDCRILVWLQFFTSKKELSPFKPVDVEKYLDPFSQSSNKGEAAFISWTVGMYTVPTWLDSLVKCLRLKQRVKVRIPEAAWDIYNMAFWDMANITKNSAYKEHRQIQRLLVENSHIEDNKKSQEKIMQSLLFEPGALKKYIQENSEVVKWNPKTLDDESSFKYVEIQLLYVYTRVDDAWNLTDEELYGQLHENYKLGNFFVDKNLHSLSIDMFGKVIKNSRDSRFDELKYKVYLNLSLVHTRLKEWRKVLDILNKASKLNIELSIKYHYRKAQAHYQLGDLDECEKELKLALSKDPQDAFVKNFLSYVTKQAVKITKSQRQMYKFLI